MRNILFFTALLLVLGGLSILIGLTYIQKGTTVINAHQVYQHPIAPIPIANSASAALLERIQAGSFIVVDVESGVTLAENNADTLFFPASTTKMMTALVAKELYQSNTEILISSSALSAGDRQTLPLNVPFKVDDLITAALVQSNNAAAMSLALADPQGYDHFVEQMNKKATDLHLTHTRFDNPVGFDGEYMQSTARDLALLGKELIKDPELKRIVGLKQVIISDAQGAQTYTLHNTNDLLGYNDQIYGIKTGTTNQAGQVLVTLAKKDDHEVIIVILDSTDRYADTKALLDWLNEGVEWYAETQLTSNN